MATQIEAVLRRAARVALTRVIPVVLVARWLLGRRRIVHGLQTLIAQGRKAKNRAALAGNFAPVPEVTQLDLKVTEGKLPAELLGTYMRNGSNPYFDPPASYHWFEGDGMVHAVRIFPDGRVTYCNRYMDTSRLAQEKKAGGPVFAKFGDQEGVRGVVVALLEVLKAKTGIIDVRRGNGTANTSLVCHANKIMALHEGDLPYQVRMLCSGVVETVGRMQVGPEWGETHFTAHPKLLAATGDLHFLGYDIEKPVISLGSLDAKGKLHSTLQVPVPWSSMMHDMAVTPRFKVLLHLPLVFDPQAMVKSNSLPIVYKPELPARFGLVPHGATSADQATWFELPSMMAFHVANAWEEGPLVKLYLCAMREFDMGATEYRDSLGSRLTEVTLDTATGRATSRVISPVVGDFPIVTPHGQGQPTRYVYTAVSDVHDKQARTVGIAKFDLHKLGTGSAPAPADAEAVDTLCGRVEFPAGCHGGEAFFVPRHADAGPSHGEDDGFLVLYVYHAHEDTSYFEVYDATTMSSTPVARVRLPQRVPYGFHGTWVPHAQLAAMAAA